MVDSCIISLHLNCILQLKQFYNIATKVSCRKKCYYFWWSTWLLSHATFWHGCGSTFIQLITSSLTAPRHYLNKFWPRWAFRHAMVSAMALEIVLTEITVMNIKLHIRSQRHMLQYANSYIITCHYISFHSLKANDISRKNMAFLTRLLL